MAHGSLYARGPCQIKVKNIFGKIRKKICTYLKLPNPEWGLLDTGHSFLPLSHLRLSFR
jgi:hypothetical protein